LAGADGERDTETEHFPAAGFEIALAPTEFLVIGTEFYREGTFGHAALTGQVDERPVQRLLVLRAGQTRADPADQTTQAVLPIASQATAARGARP
jgi:hypothetical protein